MDQIHTKGGINLKGAAVGNGVGGGPKSGAAVTCACGREVQAHTSTGEAAELPEPNLIINRYRSKMVSKGDMMNKEDILEILAIPLLGIVPDHEDIIISANRGVPAVFDEASVVGEAFRRIGRRIYGARQSAEGARHRP